MTYSEEAINKIQLGFDDVCYGLQDLSSRATVKGQKSNSIKVKEYLSHGVSRRLGIIQQAIENIFYAVPLTASKPINREKLYDVQINLHAFMINLAGVYDNFAWAFVYQHELLEEIGKDINVGLFKRKTRKHLPDSIKEYLKSQPFKGWADEYLKYYRDALAHRIPLYVPPAFYSDEDAERYQALESEKDECIDKQDIERFHELCSLQEQIGLPAFVFLHSFHEGSVKPVYLHQQIICDGLTTINFGNMFLDNWDSA